MIYRIEQLAHFGLDAIGLCVVFWGTWIVLGLMGHWVSWFLSGFNCCSRRHEVRSFGSSKIRTIAKTAETVEQLKKMGFDQGDSLKPQ